MTAAPRVSVIVPVRDNERGLARLLACLRRQTAPRADFEVIVVDDCSTDRTAAVAEESGVATVLRAPRRGGPYPARNLGAASARGGILAFTDADCEPEPSWIASGLRAMEDPALDMVAGHIEVPLGSRPTIPALVDCSRGYLDQEYLVENGFGATANMWVKREVYYSVGGFNERLLSGGDHDFGTRAVAAGASLAYRPEVVVGHEPRSKARELARKQFRIGYGAAQHLYFAEGPLRHRVHVCMRPGAYIPRRRLGLKRLHALGHRPGRLQLAAMLTVNYLYAQLPTVAGNLAGTLAQRRLPPRRPA